MKYLQFVAYLAIALLPNTALAATSSGGAAAGVAVGIFFIFIMIFYLLMLAAGIAGFIFWILMLVDAAQRTNWETENDKLVWILIVVLTGIIGALIYYFMIRKKLGPNHPHKKQ